MTDHLKLDRKVDRRLIYNITGMKLHDTDNFDSNANSREADQANEEVLGRAKSIFDDGTEGLLHSINT